MANSNAGKAGDDLNGARRQYPGVTPRDGRAERSPKRSSSGEKCPEPNADRACRHREEAAALPAIAASRQDHRIFAAYVTAAPCPEAQARFR